MVKWLSKNIIISMLIIIIVLTTGLYYGVIINNDRLDIVLATTTSTDNSGLLNYLHNEMKKDLDVKIDVVAVGTGAALEYARQGLADVVMVHARTLEDQFIKEGYGFHRVDLMYNDFVIVGPATDPAQIKGLRNSTEVFKKLFQERFNNNVSFYSRGDNSGTHVKELHLWNISSVIIDSDNQTWAQSNPWYSETGAGMGSTLTTASTSGSYTLTDRATFLFMEDKLNLEILYEASAPDDQLQNPYGIILVNPAKFSTGKIKVDLAKQYVQWLISSKGQEAINSYKIKNRQVFFADFMAHYDEMANNEKEFWGLTP